MARRVVAEHDHLDVLQAHHAVGLGPAPVIADAHAEVAAHRLPHAKAQVADLEVALLQVLEGAPGLVLGVARQVDLAVLAGDLAGAIDQDRRIEAMHRAAALLDLGKAEADADAEALRLVEQRRRLVARHLALEEAVDLLLVRHPPARKEGGERQLGENHQVAFVLAGLAQQVEHALDDGRPAVRALDGPELGRADGDHSSHGLYPGSRWSRAWRFRIA